MRNTSPHPRRGRLAPARRVEVRRGRSPPSHRSGTTPTKLRRLRLPASCIGAPKKAPAWPGLLERKPRGWGGGYWLALNSLDSRRRQKVRAQRFTNYDGLSGICDLALVGPKSPLACGADLNRPWPADSQIRQLRDVADNSASPHPWSRPSPAARRLLVWPLSRCRAVLFVTRAILPAPPLAWYPVPWSFPLSLTKSDAGVPHRLPR
jgi:hypothetical protein